MTKEEKTVEKIALLLLKSGYEDIEYIAHEALDMAIRATKAEDDPSWWERAGSPHWNKRMKRLRTKIEKS